MAYEHIKNTGAIPGGKPLRLKESRTGDASLAHKLEAQGYDWIKEELVS